MRRSAEETAAFLTAQAERMRLAPTPEEARLWERLEPLGFERQYVITLPARYTKSLTNVGQHSYILDFYFIPDPTTGQGGTCVEVDGGYHKKRKGRDRRRDTRLATAGIQTIRFTNSQVKTSLDYVVGRILAVLDSATQSTH